MDREFVGFIFWIAALLAIIGIIGLCDQIDWPTLLNNIGIPTLKP